MTSQKLEEIHPGEILLEEFMKPLGITARQLAADMDVPPSRISDIVNGARPITADTADAKLEIMEACGFTVTRNPSEMAKLLKALL